MAHGPTLCQTFVAQAVFKTRQAYSSAYISHYLDDILLAHKNEGILLSAFAHVQALRGQGLVVAPEEVQTEPPYLYWDRNDTLSLLCLRKFN